jgi:uncharacterized protein (TIGR02996 family)
MNEAGALLTYVLERPEELVALMALADWLEERGDPDSLARAELLRPRAQRHGAAGDPASQRKADKRATAILKERPALAGPLEPLLAHQFRVLAAPSLPLFLIADYASVAGDRLAAGTTWEGELKQSHYAFPTTLRLVRREGNRFEGRMRQDFTALYRSRLGGTFHFRGVVVGAHVAFVTFRKTRAAAGPGLYQFRLSRRKRLTGTWAVGAGESNGTMWLKLKPPANDREAGAGTVGR